MKKSFLLMLVLAMVLSAVYIPAHVSAIVDDTLIFSLDLSEATIGESATSSDISDIASDSVTETINVLDSSVTVEQIAGTSTKYLQSVQGTKNSGVQITDTDVNDAFTSDITLEMWIKSPDKIGGYYGAFGYHGYTSSWSESYNMMFQYNSSSTSAYIESRNGTANAGSVARITVTDNMAEWTHWVITRSYDSSKGTGKMVVYRNGAEYGQADISAALNEITKSNSFYMGLIKSGAKGSGAAIASCNIYNVIKTPAEVLSNYNAQKDSFVSQLIAVNEVLPLGGTIDSPVDISPLSGSINISFDNTFDSSPSSLSQITFTDPDGKNVGVVSPSPTSNKEVKITYAALDEFTDYKLTIGENFLSSYGKALGETVEYYYRTTEKPSLTFLDVDFESEEYVVGEAPKGDDEFIYYSSGVEGSTDNFLIRKTPGGDKYMTFDVSKVGDTAKSSQLFYEFPETLNGRSVAIDIGIRGYAEGSDTTFGTSAREVARFYKDSAYSAVLRLDTTASKNAVLNGTGYANSSFMSTPGEDSFNHIRIVASVDEDGYYFYDVYDKSDKTGKYVRFTPTGNSRWNSITKIMLAHVYPTSDDHYDKEGVAISYVKMSYLEHPMLMDTNASEMSNMSDRVKIYFDKMMDADTLENGKYTLTYDEDKTDISLEYYEYSELDNSITLKLSDYLIPGVMYTLRAQDIADVDGTPTSVTDSITLELPSRKTEGAITSTSVDWLSEIGSNASEITVNYLLTNTTSSKRNVVIFSQQLDKDGYIKKICSDTAEIAAYLSNIPKTFTVNKSSYSEGDVVKIYIWDVTDGKHSAILTKPHVITY